MAKPVMDDVAVAAAERLLEGRRRGLRERRPAVGRTPEGDAFIGRGGAARDPRRRGDVDVAVRWVHVDRWLTDVALRLPRGKWESDRGREGELRRLERRWRR